MAIKVASKVQFLTEQNLNGRVMALALVIRVPVIGVPVQVIGVLVQGIGVRVILKIQAS